MFVFGHIGLTAGLVYLFGRKFNSPVDYRYVIFGSLLSDVIDKPLGNIFLYEALNNGRIIGHSLVFVLLLTAIGIYRKNILYAAFGVWTHLLLDSMWLNQITLFWPLLGNFQHADFSFLELASNFIQPYNYIGEILGLSAIALLTLRYKLYRPGNLSYFASTGILKRL